MNGPLKCHGGKHYLAQKIVRQMPPHTHYVEPYCGGERTVGVFEIFEMVLSEYEHPLDTLVREEERQHLWEGMDRLGPLDRNTLVDHYIDGLSLRQISQNVGAPVGTIKRRLHDARHHLRRELE